MDNAVVQLNFQVRQSLALGTGVFVPLPTCCLLTSLM